MGPCCLGLGGDSLWPQTARYVSHSLTWWGGHPAESLLWERSDEVVGSHALRPLVGEKTPQLVPPHFDSPVATLFLGGILAREANPLSIHWLTVKHKKFLSPCLSPDKDICVLDVKRKVQRKLFFCQNLPWLWIPDHKRWEKWLQKDSTGRLQTRACNSMPEAAPLFSGEPYIVRQWCSCPPAFHCNMTTKKNRNPKLSGGYVHCHHIINLGNYRYGLHPGEWACSLQLTWASLAVLAGDIWVSPVPGGCFLLLAFWQLSNWSLFPFTTTSPLSQPDPSFLSPDSFQENCKYARLQPGFWKSWGQSSCWKYSGLHATISSGGTRSWMWTLVF